MISPSEVIYCVKKIDIHRLICKIILFYFLSFCGLGVRFIVLLNRIIIGMESILVTEHNCNGKTLIIILFKNNN